MADNPPEMPRVHIYGLFGAFAYIVYLAVTYGRSNPQPGYWQPPPPRYYYPPPSNGLTINL